MSTHKTIIVDWYGPYMPNEVKENPEWANGLYLASGYLKHKQSEDVHYCGVTESSFSARHTRHHKLDQITRNRRIWIGEVAYPNRPARKILELAESVVIYFWQPALNARKIVNPPDPVTLISRWHKKDRTPRLRQHPMCKDIKDVLSWDGELWRTGNLLVWEDE